MLQRGASIISMHYISNLTCTSSSSNQNNPRDISMMGITQNLTFRWSQSLFCKKLKQFNDVETCTMQKCSYISKVIPMHRRVHYFHDKFDSNTSSRQRQMTSKNKKFKDSKHEISKIFFKFFRFFRKCNKTMQKLKHETHNIYI